MLPLAITFIPLFELTAENLPEWKAFLLIWNIH